MDGVAWFDEDGDDREGAVSGEVVAFEIDVEIWCCARLWQAFEEVLERRGVTDHLGVHLDVD
jgi:hypothetical protein